MQEENPVAFESRKLTQAEQHYTVTEQELLSVVHALRIFRCYCLGNPTRVVTDHKANTFLQEQKTLSSRQARWSTFLQDYDLTWEYKPGAKNIADPLSRKVHRDGVCCAYTDAGTLVSGSSSAPGCPVAGDGKEANRGCRPVCRHHWYC